MDSPDDLDALLAALAARGVADPAVAAFLEGAAPDGRRLRETAFLVLDDAGALDLAATRAVLAALARGAAPGPDEVLDPATGRTHVVHRADELPLSRAWIDPLFPERDLEGGTSAALRVAVRPPLEDESHQLLLFLRSTGKVPAPRDGDEARSLVEAFATLGLDELLSRYGARGVYAKAARLPAGAPGALPSILRPGRAELRRTLGDALARLDAFLRGRGTLAGFEAAPGPELATAPGFAGALTRRLSPSVLYAILNEAGVSAPFPSRRADDYARAVEGAVREGRLALDGVLRHVEPALLAELASALAGEGGGRDDAGAILRALAPLRRA